MRVNAAVWRRLVVVTGLLTALVACSSGGEEDARRPLAVSAYVAPWDPRGEKMLEKPPTAVDAVSPVWYQPTDTGDLAFAGKEAQAQASSNGIEPQTSGSALIPSVSNFRDGRWDGDLVATILADPDRRRRHIEALVDVANKPGVAGVDLDYESLPAESRSAFSEFVRDLGAALDTVSRRLTVTVHAKTEEPGEWAGAQAQDWAAIAGAADEVRVMAYDDSWSESEPGPIAPLPWVEDVLRFATQQMPPEKMFLGLPTYGYDWPEGAPGQDVAWADVREIAAANDVDETWDEEAAAPWLAYADANGTRHIVWYENARSLQAKIELARRYEVGGVFIWKAGGEDPGIWAVLGEG